jgi:uncharacterized protein YceH (UPF0502 family)
MTLDPIQLRVLGALIEKEITTPENYPLSLNALIAASNQRSSRDPVLDLTEDDVRQALHSLEDLDIVASVRDARVPKYEHRIRTVLNLRRDETALLCLLLLRGPQTPGELRARADRMFPFDDIAAVQSTLERLATRGSNTAGEPASTPSADAATPLVVILPRQPGSRESRYAHLLGGPVATPRATPAPRSPADLTPAEPTLQARVHALESAVEALHQRLAALETFKPHPPAPPIPDTE